MGSLGKIDDYVLARNFTESVRLDGQHFLFVLQNGYTIDPKIPIGPDTKIAEIGTGTGVWLLDVASQVPPTVRLDGFDISDEQFPSKSSLPSNVNLQVMDAFAEVPEDHQPGGYLQWDDADPSKSKMYIKGAEAEALYSLFSTINTSFGIDHSWLGDLDNRAKEAGLNVLKFNTEPFSQPCIPILTKTFMMIHISVLDAAYQAGVPSLPSRPEADAVLIKALEAVKKGAMYHCSPVALLAQKA
ncbi:hypothetical protein ACHAQJ_002212 [Trichoderma viride]